MRGAIKIALETIADQRRALPVTRTMPTIGETLDDADAELLAYERLREAAKAYRHAMEHGSMIARGEAARHLDAALAALEETR